MNKDISATLALITALSLQSSQHVYTPPFAIPLPKDRKLWDIIQLSKSERNGKTYEELQLLRKQKWEAQR